MNMSVPLKKYIASTLQINYPFAFSSDFELLSWIHDRTSGKCGCQSIL